MKVSSTSSHHSMTSINARKEQESRLERKSNDLAQSIAEVKNAIKDMSTLRHKTEKGVKAAKTLSQSLCSVTEKYGGEACIRLKNKEFKYGQATNFIKGLVHNSRYQQERQAAAKVLGLDSNTISSRTASSQLEKKINAGNSKIKSLDSKIEESTAQLNELKEKQRSVDQKLFSVTESLADVKKTEAENKRTRELFSMLYHSNAGCRALNTEARYQYGSGSSPASLNGSKVVAEYEKAHGGNIFSRGNSKLKSRIIANSGNISELVRKSANSFYTPGNKNITTHRGQGMTTKGFNSLITQFQSNPGQAYKLGQFFSTSTDNRVAKDFANNSNDNIKVIFEIKGNSSNPLSVSGGLSFADKENERLYSPLAQVNVTSIKQDKDGTYKVTLKEIPQTKKNQLLPY